MRAKVMQQAVINIAKETIKLHEELQVDIKKLDDTFIKRVLNKEHKMPLIVAVENELFILKRKEEKK